MKIAVVTPAYNVAPFIGRTIASVIAQSYPDWAMVVVDDGSTDGTGDLAAGPAAGSGDPRVRLVRQANAGVSAARNRGVAEIGAGIGAAAVLFLDGDDFLAPDALARMAAALQAAPRAVAAYGAYAYVTEDGGHITRTRPVPFPPGDVLPALLERNLFANGGHVLIRAEAIAVAGGFRGAIVFGEDWEYWIRVALAGPFAVVPGAAPLLFVRQRAGGAYLRMATDPNAFVACMEAIFTNPALIARLGAVALARIRRRAEAENTWIVGRELLRHGRAAEGRASLLRSFAAKPSLRRAVLLAVAHLGEALPARLRGPFRR